MATERSHSTTETPDCKHTKCNEYSTKLEYALHHAAEGWKVFPLHHMVDNETCSCGNKEPCDKNPGNRGKHPLFTGGVHAATTDPAKIKAWWKANPQANIGGTRGDVIRVDLDCHDGKPNGVVAWEKLFGKNGVFKTRTHETASGGLHKFYAIPPGSPKYTNKRGSLPEGIDIQVDTSLYVVLPGSTKGDKGWSMADDAPIAPAPDELLNRLVVDDGTSGETIFGEDLPKPDLSEWRLGQKITTLIFEERPVGERSDADFAVIARLLEVGATDDEIRAVFKHYPIGQRGKYAERGDEYLATTIENAREKQEEKEPPMPEESPAGEKTSKTRGEVFNFLDALEPLPPPEWLVDRLIMPGTVGVVSGDPGAGKTYLMMSMACHVGSGLGWLGRTVIKSPVLFIDEESGPRRFKRRVGAVIRGMGDSAKVNGRAVSLPRFNLLRRDADVALIRAHVEDTGARLVVFDALVDMMSSGDENAVKDTQPVFQHLRKIASELNVAVVVIHHTGKNGDTRGSSAIEGAVDYLLIVEKQDTGDKSVLEMMVKSKKSRDTEPFKFGVRAEFTVDEYGDATTVVFSGVDAKPSSDVKFNTGELFVLKFLAVNGPSLKTTIAESADVCSSRSAEAGLYSLTKRGFVRRTDTGGSGSKATYDLTKKGEEFATVRVETP